MVVDAHIMNQKAKNMHRIKITRGANLLMKNPPIEFIRSKLGLDQIQPIHVSPGVRKDIDQKGGDVFRDWYEEELRNLYADHQSDRSN
ncbi:hypothetical protein DNHGIG_05720 [Collibacillus ludicampi]|uniref:Uncharacterized protein n=1 Tax=Collibacillus ludicampi TaxID=2771369 RepID=A0AAV4LB49_9BACL|nr:hypothetical protein [Collibacillus ludicampi]GIM45023.1 hypothetical protein DNHGIG_05720 [Collibacillus ludicampi]